MNALEATMMSKNNEETTDFLENLGFEDTAKQMTALKAIIFDTPETNQTKIEFIKEELTAGRYEIHSQTIAAKLLEYAPVVEEAEIA